MTGQRARAEALLRDVLSDGDQHPVAELERAATAVEISLPTLRRAAVALPVTRTRSGGRSFWSLPIGPSNDLGTEPGEMESQVNLTDTPVTERPALALLALEDGLTVGGRVLSRGDRALLDAEAIAATRDRMGRSWTDDLSPPAQMARWGLIMVSEIDPAELISEPGLPVDQEEQPTPSRVIEPRPFELMARRNPGQGLSREGSVPLISGFYGDRPVKVHPDRHAES